jgi:predicted ATP-grasp superfamily ATP-dependent carboligase
MPSGGGELHGKAGPPALIVGFGVHGLAIARSLGRHGIAVEAMDEDRAQPHRFSRYCHHFHVVDTTQDERVVDHLVRLGRAAGRRVALFLTRDRTVPVVSAHRDRLREYFDFTLPPPSVVNELMHKGQVGRFLEASGCRYPRTVSVADAGTLGAAGEAVGYPCVLKPALRSERFKAGIARSPDELETLYGVAARHSPECVVQQWIPGADSDVYFAFAYLDRHGTPRGLFSGRKLRQHPRGTGIAAEAEGCDDAFVREETLRLFRLAGYAGFGSTEFRRDPATGAYYLIEFTVGRTDYNVACAIANGVDLPWIGYQDTVGRGEPRPVPSQTNARRWVDLARTARAIAEARRDSGTSRVTAALELARSCSPRNAFTLFDPRDVGPFAAHALERAAALLTWAPRRVAKRLTGARRPTRLGGANATSE